MRGSPASTRSARGRRAGATGSSSTSPSMSPGYFKILGRAPAYLSAPPSVFSLPEFPANSSAQTRAELDFLLELQAKSRSPENVARSKALAGVYYRVSTQPGDEDYARMRRNLFFTGSALGEWFGPETLPKTADLMARVQSDASYYIWTQKYRFDRARPYEIEPRIETAGNAQLSGLSQRPLGQLVGGGLRLRGAAARRSATSFIAGPRSSPSRARSWESTSRATRPRAGRSPVRSSTA